MSVNVIEKWRGSSVLLNYTFSMNYKSEEELSEETVIDNLAVVVTKVQLIERQVKCFIAYKKVNEEEDVKIVINVFCDDPKFNEKCICKDNLSDWREIGVVEDTGISNEWIYSAEINVSVRKIEKLKFWENMYLDADFTDFCLSSMNGNVAVHKIVLVSHSDVFKAMLNGKWKETVEGRIEVTGITRQCLDHLKDYMYLDIVPDEGLWPLLLVAERYMIRSLKTRCIEKLVDSVTPETLYDLLDFACLNNIPELTYEILHVVPSKIVDEAYILKKKIKTIVPKDKDTGADE